MKTTLTRLHRDEHGMSMVFVGVGFMAFLAATTLAIDVGMFMTARAQAQTSADSGALAGALALYYDDYDNRSANGPAVQNALTASRSNDVINQQVSVQPADVTFPTSPAGVNNRVRVHVYRTSARDNALRTLMGRVFGVNTANIDAVATAEASPANAMTCVKPFTIPDKWIEKQDPGGFDPLNSTFDSADRHGNPLANPDIYIPADQPGYTGYNAVTDKGTELMIRAGTGNNVAPSFYFSYAIGGDTGGSAYRWNIANCNTTVHGLGRSAAHGARQHGGPDRPGRGRSDRAGSRRLLGHQHEQSPSPPCTPARVWSPSRSTTRSITTPARSTVATRI